MLCNMFTRFKEMTVGDFGIFVENIPIGIEIRSSNAEENRYLLSQTTRQILILIDQSESLHIISSNQRSELARTFARFP